MEIAPTQKIAAGMRLEIQSVGQEKRGGGVVVVREGVIGRRMCWERKWVEHELVMDEEATALCITLLIPLKWFRMGLVDQFCHYRERPFLRDTIPGPFPEYRNGEPQREWRLR